MAQANNDLRSIYRGERASLSIDLRSTNYWGENSQGRLLHRPWESSCGEFCWHRDWIPLRLDPGHFKMPICIDKIADITNITACRYSRATVEPWPWDARNSKQALIFCSVQASRSWARRRPGQQGYLSHRKLNSVMVNVKWTKLISSHMHSSLFPLSHTDIVDIMHIRLCLDVNCCVTLVVVSKRCFAVHFYETPQKTWCSPMLLELTSIAEFCCWLWQMPEDVSSTKKTGLPGLIEKLKPGHSKSWCLQGPFSSQQACWDGSEALQCPTLPPQYQICPEFDTSMNSEWRSIILHLMSHGCHVCRMRFIDNSYTLTIRLPTIFVCLVATILWLSGMYPCLVVHGTEPLECRLGFMPCICFLAQSWLTESWHKPVSHLQAIPVNRFWQLMNISMSIWLCNQEMNIHLQRSVQYWHNLVRQQEFPSPKNEINEIRSAKLMPD